MLLSHCLTVHLEGYLLLFRAIALVRQQDLQLSTELLESLGPHSREASCAIVQGV